MSADIVPLKKGEPTKEQKIEAEATKRALGRLAVFEAHKKVGFSEEHAWELMMHDLYEGNVL